MSDYKGSKICVLSSQLFLIASLFNCICGNYIESLIIFILYMTSSYYHKNPTPINKILDEYIVKLTMFIINIISLYHYNVYPTISTIMFSYMYYHRPECKESCNVCNIYHAFFIHFIGFLGMMSSYYNKNN